MNKTTDAVIVIQQPDVNDPENNRISPRQEIMTPRIYIRTFWMDYLLMAVLGGLGLGIYFLQPAPNRVFPVYFRDGEVVNPEFSYPFRKDIIPIWLAALLSFIVPFIF